MNARELRGIEEKALQGRLNSLKRNPIYFIVEDVLDTYNIGGIFRLADALAVSKLYLCGKTETPPNHRILKASVGTYKVVPWQYKRSSAEAIQELRNSKVQIIAIEQAKNSVDYRKLDYSLPIAFVLGNETDGISQQTLDMCDAIAEIPMWGINKSLNVIVSAGIVSYHALKHL